MAQLVLGLAGAAVGSLFGMPQIGFAVGSMLGSSLGPSQKVEGPRLGDLKAPQASYGAPICYVEAVPRLAGTIIWASDKREIATTTEQGGKGGPSVESTTYTYEIDALFELTINPMAGVRRIWKHGELVWNIDSAADDATLAASAGTTLADWGDAVIATGQTDHWRELRVYAGANDQMPDPTYEAAVGAGNAPAYRGRCTVMIEGLQLGASGQMPVLTFEVFSAGGVGSADDLFLTAFNGSAADVTDNPAAHSGIGGSEGSVSVSDEQQALWTGAKLAASSEAHTFEALISSILQNGTPGTGANFIWWQLWVLHSVGFAYDPIGEQAYPFQILGGVQTFGPAFTFTGGHVAIVVTPTGIRWLASGAQRWSTATNLYTGTTEPNFISVGPGGTNVGESKVTYRVSAIRLRRGNLYPEPTYTPPSSLTQRTIVEATLADVPLDQVVQRLCARAGLAAADIDVTALSGITVLALPVSQVTPTRQVLDMLAQAYLFEFVESEKLRAVLRGGASVATIPFADLGASNGEPGEPLPLRRVNDIELPAQVTVKYANTLNDFQDGSESGDRLVTDSTAVSVIEIPLGMTPTEAKRLADVATMDIAASMLAIGPVAVTREHADLEPTDVVTLVAESGSAFRARILKINDAAGVRSMDLTLDDATAINSVAATDSSYTSSTLVRPLADTDLELLDIPILRDADDAPGIYAAFGAEGKWPGAALMRSVDDVEYAEVLRATDRAVMGAATTALANWTGGNVFDESSTVTVDVGTGTLSGVTREQILNDRGRNALLIGDEIVQFRDADLQSAGVYILTGFLRGRRGTEWAMSTHGTGDLVVLLRTAGLRRVAHEQSEIGVQRYWKGVTFGKSLASAATHEFTDTGVALKPFAPVHVAASRATDGAITIEWTRRTRLATRFVGTAGINVPLGEEAEAYSIDVMNGADVVRTLAASSESADYSAADQVTDFGSTQASLTVRVHQLSATVGRGYPAEATV